MSSLYHGKLDVAPLNQFRYAMGHLLKARQESTDWNTKEIELALNHCKRAHCDYFEITAKSLILVCKKFCEKYSGKEEVFKVIPDYNDKLVKIDAATRTIEDFLTRQMVEDENGNAIDLDNMNERYALIETMKPHLEVMRNTGSAFRLAVPQIEGLLKGKFRLILVGFFLTAILSAFATWLVMYFLPAK